jgi:1-acyl-sn-glycerol-3-phosphate acyltransferase
MAFIQSLSFMPSGHFILSFFVSLNNRFLCLMQGRIRSVWRFAYFIISTALGLAGFFWSVLWGTSKEKAGLNFRREWLNRVPERLGLRMKLDGQPYHGPCLYIANHISYIDPICILRYVEAKIVAKAEISNWPMVGYSASITGTIFVQREMKQSRSRAANAVRKTLVNEDSILVFPEGTTSAGPLTLPFRPRTFDTAHEVGIPVQPIALFYDDPTVAYIGQDTFIPHFLKLSRMKMISGRIVFGPLMTGEDTCQQAKAWIDHQQSGCIKISPAYEPA